MFASQREGGTDSFYWRASDGTGTEERLTTSGNRLHIPNSVSPNGNSLIFRDGTVAGGGGGDLMTTMDGKGRPTPLVQTMFDERNGEVSPDGRWLAYESNESGPYQLYVRPFPDVNGGRWQISTRGGRMPAWARNGRELFYIDGSSFLTAVPVQATTTFTAGNAIRLFETSPSTLSNRSLLRRRAGWSALRDDQGTASVRCKPGHHTGQHDCCPQLEFRAGSPRNSMKIGQRLAEWHDFRPWLEEIKARLPSGN